MNKFFSEHAWEDYISWLKEDRKIVNKINILIKDIERNGYKGMGRPEALKHELTGYWSRRITEKDRLVYKIDEQDEQNIIIIGCKGHY